MCKFCSRAFNAGIVKDPPVRIQARARNYRNHLKNCANYQASQLVAGVTPPSALAGRSARSNIPGTLTPLTPRPEPHGVKRSRALTAVDDARPPSKRVARSLSMEQYSREERSNAHEDRPAILPFSREEKWKLERALVELHADNHLADRFIEQPSTKYFLELVRPGISKVLPSRRVLGGRLLDEHARRCFDKAAIKLRTMQEIGGRVNLVSDVWQNVNKEHLSGTILTLFGEVLTYSLPQTGDRHDGIVTAQEIEEVLLRVQSEGWDVGAVVTDDAGQCRRARQILALRWPKIVFLFCFAHDINNLVKAVLKTSFSIVTRQAASAINALNDASSTWLRRARDHMEKLYGYRMTLCSLCITRWNSMQACFASLLRVRSALQLFARQWQHDKDFPRRLRVLLDDSFWEELTRAEKVIAPLSLASYQLQRDQNTVGDVVKAFGEIYRGFKQATEGSAELVRCVEHRWAKCEQPLFMLGFALHPTYAADARNLPVTSVSGTGMLCKFAVYYYRRFIGSDIGHLRRDMFRWMKNKLTAATAEEFQNSPSEFWQYMAEEYPNSNLPDLAMKVLSVVVNSATCERLFSQLGLTQTSIRNRMRVSKLLSTEVVARHVRQRAKNNTAEDPIAKRILNPSEREIVCADIEELGLNTPTPQRQRRAETPMQGDENVDDPGDLATLDDWDEFLKEVLQDEEIGAGYSAAATTDETTIDELEAIPEPDRTPLPMENVPRFPQESFLTGIRSVKAPLAQLFG